MPSPKPKGASARESKAYDKVAVRLSGFLAKHCLVLAILLVGIASARIVATYWVFSQTSDEPAHVACGMEWLERGVYQYEAQHPPLARIAAAIGPYLMGAHSRPTTGPAGMYLDGLQIYHAQNRYDDTLAASRAGILPFFWIACAVVYLWARRDFGASHAVLALFVFTMLPPVLAHAGFATTDMALTAGLGAVFLTAREWLACPTPGKAVWFGAAGALALLSKFSSLPFFPAAAAIALIWYFAAHPEARGGLLRSTIERLPTLGLAAAVTAVLVWTVYRFSFGPVTPGGISLPAPEFFRGIGEVLKHNREGHISYLLGEFSPNGFPHFYFVVLAVKTPLPVLLLTAAGIVFAVRGSRDRLALALPSAFAGAVLLVSMASRINIGVRHILPIYMGMSILAAAAAWRILEAPARRWLPAAVAVLGVWLTGASLLSHPDYLPYFNELAGSHPENILVDSDLDWGQDVKRLTLRLQRAGAKLVTFTPSFPFDPRYELPPLAMSEGATPFVGWNAVCFTRWKLFNLDLPRDGSRPWPDRVPRGELIGKSILLWRFPVSTGLPLPH